MKIKQLKVPEDPVRRTTCLVGVCPTVQRGMGTIDPLGKNRSGCGAFGNNIGGEEKEKGTDLLLFVGAESGALGYGHTCSKICEKTSHDRGRCVRTAYEMRL